MWNKRKALAGIGIKKNWHFAPAQQGGAGKREIALALALRLWFLFFFFRILPAQLPEAREHCRERAAGLRFTKPSLENCTAPQYKKNMYKNVDSMARHAVAPGAGWLAGLGTYTGCIIGCGRYVDTSTTCASAHSRTSRQPKDCSTPPIRNAVSVMV